MASKIREIVEQASNELSLELWDMEWENKSGSKILKIMVDTDEGININQCVALNKLLCERIADEDVKGEYQLEVSSPGVERKLSNLVQIKKYINSDVYVKLYEKLEGTKEIYGKIVSAVEHPLGYVVTIDDGNKRIELHKENIATIRTYIK